MNSYSEILEQDADRTDRDVFSLSLSLTSLSSPVTKFNHTNLSRTSLMTDSKLKLFTVASLIITSSLPENPFPEGTKRE